MSAIALVSEHASPLAALGTTDAGGQNVYVACLAAALSARGHRVTVFTRRDDPSIDRSVTVTGPAPYRVVHLDAGPPEPIDKDLLFPHMDDFAAGLHAAMEHDRPDVVHSHFWMSGHASSLAASLVGVPWVHTFHALGTVKRRHQGTDDHSPPQRIDVERRLLRDAAQVVATCTDEVAELRRLDAMDTDERDRRPSVGVDDVGVGVGNVGIDDVGVDNVVVVPCGYDAAVFRPEGPRLPRSERHVLAAVSRLVPRKGLDVVVQALSCLPDTELVVAGGPPRVELPDDAHHRQLCALAEELGVADRLRFAGGVAPATVAAIDRTADVFVAVPRYEPFGIAPVEAMACGTPVVATAVGGMLDTVVDGGTGSLVPVDDADAVARAVRALLDAPARRAAAGARAAWRTRRRYGWDVIARSMEAVYADVTGVHHAASGAPVPVMSGARPADARRPAPVVASDDRTTARSR